MTLATSYLDFKHAKKLFTFQQPFQENAVVSRLRSDTVPEPMSLQHLAKMSMTWVRAAGPKTTAPALTFRVACSAGSLAIHDYDHDDSNSDAQGRTQNS